MTRRLTTLAPILVAVAALAGCGRASKSGSGAEAEERPDTLTVPVAVEVVELGPAASSFRSWGTVRPAREAVILSELTGRVARVEVSLGDAVEKDHLLLEIDPELYEAKAHEAETRVTSSETARERAQKELKRRETLFAGGTVSDSELEAARSAAADADAAVASAQAELQAARKQLAGARLRAPFRGHVASRPPDVGSTVNPGTPLLTLVDVERLRVETLISEQDLPSVSQGTVAQITVTGAPGKVFSGRVTAIGPATDASTKQFPVEIEVVNPSGHPLKGGMVARVEIVTQRYESIPLVPVDALVEDGDDSVIYVVEEGVAHRRPVTVGPRLDQMAGILEGAAAGDSVVVLGQLRLAEGTPVRVEEVR
jgi:RND family efflux transporter MFP subunit